MRKIVIVEALDKYFSQLYLVELRDKYLQKYPGGLVVKIQSVEELKQHSFNQSLFESQKLLLVDLPVSDFDKLLAENKKFFDSVNQDWVIIISEKLKKSSRLYKVIQKNKNILLKSINSKTTNELEKHFSEKYQFSSNQKRRNLQKIISWFPNDSYRIFLELEKLSLLEENSSYKLESIVEAPESENIFQIIDEIISNKSSSLADIDSKIKNGLDPTYLIAMLANSLRQMLLLKINASSSLFEASKKSGVPYFIARKFQRVYEKASYWDLKKIFAQLSDYDFMTKTGKINSRVAFFLLLCRLSKVL